MKQIVAFPGNEAMTRALAPALEAAAVDITIHRFPDGESRVTVAGPVAGNDVAVVCTLDHPDGKFLPLLLLAATLRDLGAARLVLVAPYLAYMRQDRRFHDGEGVSSTYVARWLSAAFDALVTVDPHLHRHASLDEIFSIPAGVAHAAAEVARWIQDHVPAPAVIGPDRESAQWVRGVAEAIAAPWAALDKDRRGDRDVAESPVDVTPFVGRTPVVVDDIIATGTSMIAAVRALVRAGMPPPVCIGVHGILVEDAERRLLEAGAARVVTCNTVPHPTNAIDVSPAVARAVAVRLA